MHPDLLDLLACPSCRGDLEIEGGIADPADGWLACTSCGERFPVRMGIPRLVPNQVAADSNQVAAQFHTEFSALSDEDRDMDPLRLREYYFFSRTGLDPQIFEAISGDPYRTELPKDAYLPDGAALADKVVLDAGCGPGRFTEVAALHGSRLVVGLELGDHIERAARRCAHLPNVAFVQGSVLALPFKPQAFQVVFSIGVLHHTESPEAGARALATAVAPEGLMSLWLYPPEYWGRGPQRPIARAVHRFVSAKEPDGALRFCEKWLYPLGKLQIKVEASRVPRYLLAPLFLVKVPRHPVREVMATIFDYYGPARISTHEPSEIAGWLLKDGFLEVQTLPVRSSVIGRKASS